MRSIFLTVSIPIHPGFVEQTLLARLLLDLVRAESKDTTVRLDVPDEDKPASGGACGYVSVHSPDKIH